MGGDQGIGSDGVDEARPCFTVGHSNIELDALLALLKASSIELLVDVRSVPSSRYSPQFNRQSLEARLAFEGIDYVFLGDGLGGRPNGDEYYDADGHVRYDLVAEAPFFLQGLEALEGYLGIANVAMVCSEGDPTNCHRRLLIARVLRDRGVKVQHIMRDGSVVADEDLPALPEPSVQVDLFGEEVATWRSVLPVSRGGEHGSSSRP